MPLSQASDLPTGTATFLFTDIQGSTKLVQELGIERWKEILDTHYQLLRKEFEAHQGHEVNTEGDAFFIAFAQASEAVAASAAAQRALYAHDWPPDAVIRVRMGLHTGEAAMVGGDYMGIEIHRAARIASSAHGGQVVLSDTTRALVDGALPDGVGLVDLGDHRLKDLARPERIWQLRIDGLPADFPGLKSLDLVPNNLPTQLTSFIGREKELEAGLSLLDANRLLTLTGPGGTGKTRLSLQIAAEASDDFKDGVFFVPLAPITDPELVPSTVLEAMSIHDIGSRSPQEALLEQLRDRRALLVMDNFEQLLPAAVYVADILKASPKVKVITSSRAPLKVYGEQEFPVPPLGVPDPTATITLEALNQFEAVKLFVDRAVALKPDFQVTNENAPAVAGITALVDGLPLAVELAAARIKLLSPQAMLTRLESRLGELGGGARDLPERQQTLRGAISWSYDLLDEGRKKLFERFAVFVRGGSLVEVEAVCGPPQEIGGDVLDGLEVLVEQSLLRLVEDTEEPRFIMLHVIREFALEQLAGGGEDAEVRQRHAKAYLELAEAAAPKLTSEEQGATLDRLDMEHDNVRAALAWFQEQGDPVPALRLVTALWRFWTMRGHVLEGAERIDAALDMTGQAEHPVECMLALEAAGGLAWWQAELDTCVTRYEAALAIARELQDDAAIARNLYNLIFPATFRRDVDRAYVLTDEATTKFRALGDELGEARVAWIKGSLVMQQGRVQEAMDLHESAVTAFRKEGTAFDLTWGLHGITISAVRLGRLDRAWEATMEGIELIGASDVAGLAIFLTDFSDLAYAEGDIDRAIRLKGATEALQGLTGSKIEGQIADDFTAREEAELTKDPDRYRTLREEGMRMSAEEALAYAKSGHKTGAHGSNQAPAGSG